MSDTTRRPRVLVCDDDPVLPRVLRRYLEDRGYEVAVAVDGEAAIAEAAATPPDLILMDLQLPRRDGYSVLVHLRGQPATRATPVFMLSAEPREVHGALAHALGASGYLEKPCQLADVLGLLGAASASPAAASARA